MMLNQITHEFSHFCLFCGLGGISLGLNQGHARVGVAEARLRCLGGIDVDPMACRDFERLTGSPATHLDLFDREDYELFHGHAPPEDWREATVDDIRRAAGGECPDILATSPPCKGFSGLLNSRAAASPKYQALNNLVLRGLVLCLEAFRDDPPALILLENVPRIQQRGRSLLDQVVGLLLAHGYTVAETTHDCGELGGLAQHRKRFLLVARHRAKVAPFLYEPPRRPVQSVGAVLGDLPLPEDPAAGPMHTLPRLQWRTWVRLGLIEAGKDWRSLQDMVVVDGHLRDIGIEPLRYGLHHGKLRVERWDEPAHTITGSDRVGSGALSVANPRFARTWGDYHAYRVLRFDQTAETITSKAAAGSGAFSVADPRLQPGRFNNVYRLVRWGDTSPCVTSGVAPGSGGLALADPRFTWSRKKDGDWSGGRHYGVLGWDDTAGAVIGSAKHDNGAWSVADPRVPARSIDEPRLPEPKEQLKRPPVIVALDGTWHRPFTTLELAALQGFPVADITGRPLRLESKKPGKPAHGAWRTRIGNAVPPPTMAAIGGVMAETLLRQATGQTFVLSASPVWVRPLAVALSVDS